MQYILSVDQGTTGTRAVLFDEKLNIVCSAYCEHAQIVPCPGQTEHDAMEILHNVKKLSAKVLMQAKDMGIDLSKVRCMGLANQGETVVAWDRTDGKPLAGAVVWHCTRSAGIAAELASDGAFAELVRKNTGLMIDAYFSATKIVWLRENVPAVKQAVQAGNALFGTLDSFLIWSLTGRYVTDAATASRTMLFNIHTGDWDAEILKRLDIDRNMLPEVLDNCADFGTATIPLEGEMFEVPITSSVVDQQGALFGQGCFAPGMAKATYGTGCFTLMNTGEKPVYSSHGLLTSIGWRLNGKTTYVLDGAIYMAGAVTQWLRDKMQMIENYGQLDEFSLSVPDNAGVYFVTAFSGLSAPIWNPRVKGTLVGLTTAAKRAHFVRAALESVAYQVGDLLTCFSQDFEPVRQLRVDGGLSQSRFLMQFQADIADLEVTRMKTCEVTARGVAMMAGLTIGLFTVEQLKAECVFGSSYHPAISSEKREQLLNGWSRAVRAAEAFAE